MVCATISCESETPIMLYLNWKRLHGVFCWEAWWNEAMLKGTPLLENRKQQKRDTIMWKIKDPQR